MNAQREDCSPSAITGNILHSSERHTVAIYRRDGQCWVANFQDGCGELTDAASWFRSCRELYGIATAVGRPRSRR